MTERILRVGASEARLDRFIAEHCPDLTRSQAQRLIREGYVTVNGSPRKASYCPNPGDVVCVQIPSPSSPTPDAQPIALKIVYEDRHLLVVDKPAGMVVHPGAGQSTGTLVNALLARRPDIAQADLDPQRPGIVHRLDRDTSGLMVVAATREVQSALQKLFREHRVEKTYLALLAGRLVPERGAIEAPIARHPTERTRMAIVRQGGRYARTEYRVREYLMGCTLVEAMPLTGRTHQLRAHFSSIGHPVIGDRVYGHRRASVEAPRQFLHAWRLAFDHPVTGERLAFEAELPPDLAAVLVGLRAGPQTELPRIANGLTHHANAGILSPD